MPARRNRPGKCGTAPIAVLHSEAEQRALELVDQAGAKNSVYWADRDNDIFEACKRLTERGVLEIAHSKLAFRRKRPVLARSEVTRLVREFYIKQVWTVVDGNLRQDIERCLQKQVRDAADVSSVLLNWSLD